MFAYPDLNFNKPNLDSIWRIKSVNIFIGGTERVIFLYDKMHCEDTKFAIFTALESNFEEQILGRT